MSLFFTKPNNVRGPVIPDSEERKHVYGGTLDDTICEGTKVIHASLNPWPSYTHPGKIGHPFYERLHPRAMLRESWCKLLSPKILKFCDNRPFMAAIVMTYEGTVGALGVYECTRGKTYVVSLNIGGVHCDSFDICSSNALNVVYFGDALYGVQLARCAMKHCPNICVKSPSDPLTPQCRVCAHRLHSMAILQSKKVAEIELKEKARLMIDTESNNSENSGESEAESNNNDLSDLADSDDLVMADPKPIVDGTFDPIDSYVNQMFNANEADDAACEENENQVDNEEPTETVSKEINNSAEKPPCN